MEQYLLGRFKEGLKELNKGGIIKELLEHIKTEYQIIEEMKNVGNLCRMNIQTPSVEQIIERLPYTSKALEYGSILQENVAALKKIGKRFFNDGYFTSFMPVLTNMKLGGVSVYSDEKTVDVPMYTLIEELNVTLGDDTSLREIFFELIDKKKSPNNVTADLKLAVVMYCVEALYLMTNLYQADLAGIISSLDVEKFKPPFPLIYSCFYFLSVSELPIEDVCSLFGKFVVAKAKYLKENNSDDQSDKQIVLELSQYFNEDGTIKSPLNSNDFEKLLRIIGNPEKKYYIRMNQTALLFNHLSSLVNGTIKYKEEFLHTVDAFVNCFKVQSNKAQSNAKSDENGGTHDSGKGDKLDEVGELTVAIDYVEKYYDPRTKKLKSLPEDVTEFKIQLSQTSYSIEEQTHIISLIAKEQERLLQEAIFSPLSPEQRQIYNRASSFLDTIPKSHECYYELRQLLDDCYCYLELFMEANSENDKRENLGFIAETIKCIDGVYKAHAALEQSAVTPTTNRYVFLLEDNVKPFIEEDNVKPFIETDINDLDGSCSDGIDKLIARIFQDNKSNFRPVEGSKQTEYAIQEITASKIHIAFIEIDGVYVIVGVQMLRKGYNILANRVDNNLDQIRTLAASIKNPDTRDSVLREHEEIWKRLFADNDKRDRGPRKERKKAKLSKQSV